MSKERRERDRDRSKYRQRNETPRDREKKHSSHASPPGGVDASDWVEESEREAYKVCWTFSNATQEESGCWQQRESTVFLQGH